MAERPDVVVLKNVRLGFAKLWKAEAATADATPKFGASLIIEPGSADEKANLKACDAAVAYVAKKTWADKAERIVGAIERKRKSYRDGDGETNEEGETWDGFAGTMIVVAKNNKRPQILNRDKTPLAEEDGVVYSGCYVDAVVSFYTTSKKEQGGNGIFSSLEIVRFRKDGDSFGAGKLNVDDYLDDVEDDDVI